MSKPTLIPIEDNTPCPFVFFEEKTFPDKVKCKIYNDGGHYVGIPYFPEGKKRAERTTPTQEKLYMREMFDSLYAHTVTERKKKEEAKEFLRANLCHLFEEEKALDEFIDENIKRKTHNLHARKSRFRKKANLNEWTHFITITYSDEKHSEDNFRKKLRKCLCNLHTRRNWRYMGVFERAPETGRLHFHALMYIPDGEMIGNIEEKRDYSTKQKKMQITYENSFFAKAFGRNDFKEICPVELKYGNGISYLLKYIDKTGDKLTYSRGVPTEIYREIDGKDIVCEMRDFVLKYVLFDDVLDWETDIKNKQWEQMSLADISPHWLC